MGILMRFYDDCGSLKCDINFMYKFNVYKAYQNLFSILQYITKYFYLTF